jgi:hypothetical protein
MIRPLQAAVHRSTRTALPLATVHCSLSTVHCSLSTAHCSLTAGLPKFLLGVSDIEQTPAWQGDTVSTMSGEIHILKVETDGEDGLIVTFSDGTTCGYVVEELLEMRPIREAVKETAPAAD